MASDTEKIENLKKFVVHEENNGQISHKHDDRSYEGEYFIQKIIDDVNRKQNGRERKSNQKEQLNETSIMHISQHFTMNHELLRRTIIATITPKIFKERTKKTRPQILNNQTTDNILEKVGYVSGQKYDKGHIVGWSLGGTNHPLNLIPMRRNFNREGAYRILEDAIINDIAENNRTYHIKYVIKFQRLYGMLEKTSKCPSCLRPLSPPMVLTIPIYGSNKPQEMIITSEIFDKNGIKCGVRVDIVDLIRSDISTLSTTGVKMGECVNLYKTLIEEYKLGSATQ